MNPAGLDHIAKRLVREMKTKLSSSEYRKAWRENLMTAAFVIGVGYLSSQASLYVFLQPPEGHITSDYFCESISAPRRDMESSSLSRIATYGIRKALDDYHCKR